MQKGKLYIVATPIGNLGDITIRAIETLRSVAFVLAEDTRETAKLLNKHAISATLVSYRDQNHERIKDKIVEKLNLGLNLALVSDSGTPVISDPGFKLVRELKDEGYEIVPIPGPNAAVSAMSVSGVSADKFIFLGFLPKSEIKRIEMLERYGNIDASIIIYESPNRLVKLLDEINTALGDRKVCVANDLTKLYEKVVTSKVSELISQFRIGELKLKGEFVVLIDKE